MRNKNSILFVRPDYHCSFFYRDEFRRLGWKADIFVDWNYPSNLLYSDQGLLRPPRIQFSKNIIIRWINYVLSAFWWLSKFWRYEYHLYYGRPPAVNFFENKLLLTKLFGFDFLLELWLSKFFGVKLLYLPTGCHDEETRENFGKLDDANICNNCGFYDRCDDKLHNLNFARIRRFFNAVVGFGSVESSQFKKHFVNYKSIDLKLWSPEIAIPSKLRLPAIKNLRILHSTYLENSGRRWKGRNIKGSPYVLEAIEKLKAEGYPIEYYYITNKPSNQIRFYQAQADIIVEQLIYGCWGSTGVETMALGKPVVCYLRKDWKERFFMTFPEFKKLPIVEANTETVYEQLKNLVKDAAYRREKGIESRLFAESFFDPVKNTKGLIKVLKKL